jgi:hypothetical protein
LPPAQRQRQRDLHFGDLLPLASRQPSITPTNSDTPELTELAIDIDQVTPLHEQDILDHQRNTVLFPTASSLISLEPRLATPFDTFANYDPHLLTSRPAIGASEPMSGMARHGSVGAFSGFSVCQPALGASLQWLPAIGTAELDDMINAFLPGAASIQDKRAHISMDFFEFSRQTGETFKFYPVPTPATASPATSAFYDSGYASGYSPVLSEGSWTQSPAPFAPAASDARTKSRSSASKKSSTSSSRQVDFASHPGMRILTKDGKDVTNSASRGCKTKEQRDHAHLMRIIKACDACKKKKIRCDPSHRKRTASQASASQAEQKPAKKPRKAEAAAPVAVANAAADLAAGDVYGPETLSFPSFDTSYPHDFEAFWNDFVTLDQEPVAAAPAPALDDFVFDSFTDIQSFFSPSSGSTATSPSQILTPFTPARSNASPITAPDFTGDVPGEIAFQDLAVPYLNPGVAHGTDYADFNLYSPGPEVYDEDPVLQMRDLGSQQHSPRSQQSPQSSGGHTFAEGLPRISGVSAAESHIATTLSAALGWYYDPGDTGHTEPQPSAHRPSSNRQLTTNHNRLDQEGVGGPRWPSDGQLTNRRRHIAANGSDVVATSSVQSPDVQTSAPNALCRSASIVVANAPQSSVSPDTTTRTRRITTGSPGGSPSSPAPTKATQYGKLGFDTCVESSLPTATVCHKSLQHATNTASPAAGDTAPAGLPRPGHSCVSSPVLRQRLAGSDSGSSARLDVQQIAAHKDTGAVNPPLATIQDATLPTRRNVAGKEHVSYNTCFFQLAVLGLVSLLCASAFSQQAHLASQVNNLVNIVFITTSISLARFVAPRCAAGPSSSATWVASRTLPPSQPPPTPSDFVCNVKSKIQSVVTGSPDLRSKASRWARSFLPPRPPSVVRALRL